MASMYNVRWLSVPHLNLQITDNGVHAVLRVIGPALHSLVLTQLTDALVRSVAGACNQLRSLDLSHLALLEGAGIAAIGESCPLLEELSLNGCRQLPEHALLKVAQGCPKMRALDVAHCIHVTDMLLATLAQSCRHLQRLIVNGCKEVSDRGLHALSNSCLDLVHLELHRTEFQYKITDMFMLSISEHCKILQHINVSGCDHITDAGLSWLCLGCTALTAVDVSYCDKLTDFSLRALAEGCLHLTTLDISGCARITDIGLRFLSIGCHELVTLTMKGVIFASAGASAGEPQGISAIGLQCTQIEHLDVTKCLRIDDVALKKLPLRHLVHLCLVHCTKVTSDGVIAVAAHCPKLSVLNLTGCVLVDDHALASIGKGLHALESLKLRGCDRVSSGGLQRVSHGCRLLKTLDLAGCILVDDMGLLAISDALVKLQNLWLTGLGRITMVGVAWLADKCTHLMHLDVSHSAISYAALKPLRAAWKYGVLREMASCRGIFPQHRAADMLFIDEYGHCWKAAIMIQVRGKILCSNSLPSWAVSLSKQDRPSRCCCPTRRCTNALGSSENAERLPRSPRTTVCIGATNATSPPNRCSHAHSGASALCTYRAKKARELAARLQRQRAEAHRLRMAIRIQSSWRALQARKLLRAQRQLVRATALARQAAALVIQRTLRRFVWCKRCRVHLEAVAVRRRERDAAARKLQALYRGRAARSIARSMHRELAAALAERERAAALLQRALRRRRERRIFWRRVERRVAENAAATRVQRRFRARQHMLGYQMLQLARQSKAMTKAARKVQSAWRCKQGRMGLQMLRFLKDAEYERRTAAATKLQTIFRGRKAREHAAKVQQQNMMRLIQESKVKSHMATVIQAGWRGKKGRDRHRAAVLARKKRWKEVPNPENGTKTYYHQDTGEIRYRMPQDLLDLLPRPGCNDCDEADAAVECKDCEEVFCKECWDAIHAGGKRRRHAFRALYDYYDKRVDYGDGEFPSLWPTEVEQDELDGWRLRTSDTRDPAVVVGDWEKYIDPDARREWYYNCKTKVSTYLPPPELRPSAEDEAAAWVRKLDETNRVTYYFNEKTGRRTFERPAAFVEPPEPTPVVAVESSTIDSSVFAPVQLGNWTQYWDELHQVYYYFNSSTQESTYTSPDGLSLAL
ncbi:hypothetical protein ACHHYP_15691 [Achlya hypogyna]|uniref:WW domain-containing protein n=1 Tax=Achlya hypogyna TaxID=1202772 RepID=A0A1V9YA87_ACHHY|nr:hypothetical protein ACHHYP_15691 [Achlya hypogyna]